MEEEAEAEEDTTGRHREGEEVTVIRTGIAVTTATTAVVTIEGEAGRG